MVTNSTYIPGTEFQFLTLAQAKKQLKIEDSFAHDDELITEYIAASQVECENYCGISFSERKFVMEANGFDDVLFQMNYVNDAVEKIEYYNEANELVTLPAENYKFKTSVNAGCFEVKFINAPKVYDRIDAVKITVNQGWAVESVPTPVKQAMKLLISDYYERREDRGGMTTNTRAFSLLRPYKKY
jgi:uncharacterized phiE125 gp8 family phage protein